MGFFQDDYKHAWQAQMEIEYYTSLCTSSVPLFEALCHYAYAERGDHAHSDAYITSRIVPTLNEAQ